MFTLIAKYQGSDDVLVKQNIAADAVHDEMTRLEQSGAKVVAVSQATTSDSALAALTSRVTALETNLSSTTLQLQQAQIDMSALKSAVATLQTPAPSPTSPSPITT